MGITGIVLAGGKSTRMGADKALLIFDNKTLLERSVELCNKLCNQILISSNSEKHKIEGIQQIADEFIDCGPIGGIYSCMKYSINEWVFVISVDSTFVDPDFVTSMLNYIDEFDAIIPQHKNGKEPLIGFYNCKIIPVLKTMIENCEYKMHTLLDNIHTKYIESEHWKDKNPLLFQNLNYPFDLNTKV